MPAAAAIVAGGAIVGALVQSNASSKAASAQANAAKDANALAYQQWQQNREDQAPWRAAGQAALNQLTAGTQAGGQFNRNFSMADFQADPGYAFRLAEGQKALERSGAARGMTLSGAQSKALTNYGQNMGSQEYGNAFNRFQQENNAQFGRLSTLAGFGQSANAANQQGSQNYVNNYSQNMAGIGNAQAAGSIGSANAINSGINSGINAWQSNNMWNALQSQNAASAAAANPFLSYAT